MAQRKALVDRFGQPVRETVEGPAVTRVDIIQALNQLRAEMNAMLRFNDVMYAVMEERHPGFMAEVIRRLEQEVPDEVKNAVTQ